MLNNENFLDDSPDKMRDKSGELGDHGNSLEDDGCKNLNSFF